LGGASGRGPERVANGLHFLARLADIVGIVGALKAQLNPQPAAVEVGGSKIGIGGIGAIDDVHIADDDAGQLVAARLGIPEPGPHMAGPGIRRAVPVECAADRQAGGLEVGPGLGGSDEGG
jgi:hypothetical protein